MSRQAYLIREFLLRNKVRERGRTKTLLQLRTQDDLAMKAAIRAPRGTVVDRTTVAGMDGMWVRAAEVPPDDRRTLLYFHGGGFYSGSCETHRGLAAAISEASGIRALLIDYRLAPEHMYPAAHEDTLAAYRWLLEEGIEPGSIVIGGDSAGGNLTLATLLNIRDEGLPVPAAGVLLSPWLDVWEMAGESYVSRRETDPSIDTDSILNMTYGYFGTDRVGKDMDLLRRNMRGLPPLLIQVGDLEVLLSDAETLAEQAREAGVDVTLEVWPDLWHVFQALTAILPEAREAVGHIGEFISRRIGE